tara:strand:- start:74 stop:499 length:426 start_codon:yes stop_codon:yes gene_type:complete
MSDEPVHFQLSEVVRWLRAHDKRNLCFGGWPDDILEIYLRWHHANGSLFMVEDRGSLVALGVGTQMDETDIDRHWVTGRSTGNAFYVSDVVATKKEGVAACVDEMRARCPRWRELKLYALRHGKKRRLSARLFDRLLDKWK